MPQLQLQLPIFITNATTRITGISAAGNAVAAAVVFEAPTVGFAQVSVLSLFFYPTCLQHPASCFACRMQPGGSLARLWIKRRSGWNPATALS